MKIKALAASIAALAAIALIDYRASNDLVLDQFFLVPVAVAAWFGGRRYAWAIATAAAAAWVGVNYLNGHPYLNEHNRYWNGLLVLVRLLIAGTIVAVLREALDAAKRSLAEKEEALRALQVSTAEIRAYRGQFQTICAWTNQIKDGDEWISFPEFLSRHLQTQVTHGISPEAAAKIKAELRSNSEAAGS